MQTHAEYSSFLTGRGVWAVLSAALIGGLIFILVSRSLLEHVPTYDELLHVVPARGVVATGKPVMADGAYHRAELFTRAVAVALEYRGDNLVAARLPAWLSAIALVALIGAWVARRGGFLAGLLAAAILSIMPTLFQTSVLVRFYAPHALASVGALIALFEALQPGRRMGARALLLLIAASLLGLAWHFQIITVVTLGAAVAGAGALVVFDRWDELRRFSEQRRGLTIAILVTLFVGAAIVLGLLSSVLLERLGEAPLWARAASNRVGYYAQALREDLPLLWPLFPVAVVLAFKVDRRLAVYCAAVLLSALIVHSIAPFKASRYILYLMPFMAVLWGCALSRAIFALAERLQWFSPLRMVTSHALAFALIAVLLANSVEGMRAVKLIVGKARAAEILPYANEGDWVGAASILAPLAKNAKTIIVSSGVKGLYALGDYDYELNASVVFETITGQEFGVDKRSGRYVIGAAESVRRVLDEPGSALIVADVDKVDQAAGIAPGVVDLIQGRCVSVPKLEKYQIMAWTCE